MNRKIFFIGGIGLALTLCVVGVLYVRTFSSSDEERSTKEPKEIERKEEIKPARECIVSGCSGQLCLDKDTAQDVFTTCEWKEKYGCYREARCIEQEDGTCGWTKTPELLECLQGQNRPKEVRRTFELDQKSQEDSVETKVEPKTQEKSTLEKVNRWIDWGFKKALDRNIDSVIVHSSFNALGGDEYDLDALLRIYKTYGVGAHYCIDRLGTIYHLIRENDIAYHAGVSTLPDGRSSVNEVSIGIELIANYDDGYTDAQYESLNDLLGDIYNRHDIQYTLGHNDIAPERKTDPWNMDWKKIERKS